jgi:phage terminase small subunit
MVQRGRKSLAALAVVPIQPEPHRAGSRGDLPAPPPHLDQPERKIWNDVLADLPRAATAPILGILAAGCEAHARARLAAAAIAADGMSIRGRDGQVKAHPLLAVERDQRAAYVSALRAISKPPPKKRRHNPGGFGWQPEHFDDDE